MLTRAGHEVVEMADGSQAIEAYRAQPGDPVPSDIYPAGVDGVEAIIRYSSSRPDLQP
jgi:CheY-like chemotaxis protein